jgi:hypothetical protein
MPVHLRVMHHPTYMPRSSAIGIITAASAISGLTDLGELPDSVVQWMALPERVTKVKADNRVMFHWADHPDHPSPNDSRGDTATYQWVGKAIRAVVANPHAGALGNEDRTYQIIGRVEPHDRYLTLQYLRLILKYVPSTSPTSGSGTPEIWLRTYIPLPRVSFAGDGKAQIVFFTQHGVA